MPQVRVLLVKPTVISTFAGCGGSSLGYKWAGFKELLAIDFEPHAVKTFRLNFPDVDVWQADIREVTADMILERIGIKKGELDVLDGSPPCQGFSTAGKRKVSDSRNDLSWEFIRLIEGLRPRAFIMENVSGMAKGGMKGQFNEILTGMKETGYRVECRKLNAMWYGVPQSRERLIWIGMRDGQEIEWPVRQEIITLREALEGVPDGLRYNKMSGKQARLAKELRPGQTGADIYGPGKWFSHRKARWDRPAATILLESWQIYHPDRSEPFTIAELKRLFSFPDSFQFPGTWREAAARMGNSVPPKFMQAIAECVKEVLEGDRQ